VSDNLIHSHRIPADKVITIYNGIDVDYYSPDRKELAASGQEIRNEYKLTEDTVLIGGIGRLVGGKGFEYLINSIPEITNTYPDVRIIIVGEGPLRTSLEELGKRLEVSRNLIFVGFRKDIREILSAIDILVMPSLAEGFPMITLEAMAMAKPTVATEIEGTTEQIVNGKTGVLVPPGDSKALSGAIIDLLKNRTHAEEMGRLARGYAIEYFPVEKMVHSTVKVYWELIGETQSSHNN
jgi:glycosyltransferase involved in cell wall biosynthesis